MKLRSDSTQKFKQNITDFGEVQSSTFCTELRSASICQGSTVPQEVDPKLHANQMRGG